VASIGKRVFDELYVHLSGLDQLKDNEQRRRVADALCRVTTTGEHQPNVAKINLRTGRVSLLAYKDFEETPFPELAASWVFASSSLGPPLFRVYADSMNPPILHRKELLVPASHPRRDMWVRLTATAEALGLFEDTTTIGFKLNWEQLIASKGYSLAGDAFVPLGNETSGNASTSRLIDGQIQRHLTALTRSSLSAPIQLLLRHELVRSGTSVFW
jgi:hypothetical protein